MTRNSFTKLAVSTVGITAAALAIVASSPKTAFAEDAGTSCPGGTQACQDVQRCVGVAPYVVCVTDHYYQKPPE